MSSFTKNLLSASSVAIGFIVSAPFAHATAVYISPPQPPTECRCEISMEACELNSGAAVLKKFDPGQGVFVSRKVFSQGLLCDSDEGLQASMNQCETERQQNPNCSK